MSDSKRVLLSGDEAVALAALHAGVALGTGYPGTPSTEILETFLGTRRTRAMGAERKSRPRSRAGRGIRRGAGHRHDETRRPERRGRPVVYGGVHRRDRRADRGVGRRSRHGFQPERAGQPALRGGRRRADAGTVGFAGSLRPHSPGGGDFRTLEDPRPAASDHAGLPQPDHRSSHARRTRHRRRRISSATSAGG